MADPPQTNPSIDRNEHDYGADTKKVTLWDIDSTTGLVTRISNQTLQNLTDQLAHLVATLEAGLPSYDAAGWRQRVVFDTASNMNTLFAMGSTSGQGAYLTNNIPPDMSNISWGVLRNKITTS